MKSTLNLTQEQLNYIALEAQKELARREFFYFCKLMAPDFYKEERNYQVTLCNEMQNFYESGDEDVLIINMPPRFGKSRTASLFVAWVLGKNQNEKIMTGSYSEDLSTTFSKTVRNMIQEEKADWNKIVYSDIFPGVRIKKGDAAMNLWSLENGYNNYLATSPGARATGYGATLLIIDDLIKNADEALNENHLEKLWRWFTDTMLTRLEQGGKIIVVMTRWATGDLAGRLLEHCKEYGWKYRHVSMKALQDDGTMLCEDVLNYESYQKKIQTMSPEIASANYQQEPIDIQGRLYNSFKTYTDIPKDENGKSLLEGIYGYCDTADTGDDYLCMIIWGVYNMEAYVLDVLYTKEPMEVTERRVADMIYQYKPTQVRIEANLGATAFPRTIGRILVNTYRYNGTRLTHFYQRKNKRSRILSNATWIMDHVYYPVNWRDRWPEYFKAMTTYQREGTNKHDDAPDATTGVAETMELINAGKLARGV